MEVITNFSLVQGFCKTLYNVRTFFLRTHKILPPRKLYFSLDYLYDDFGIGHVVPEGKDAQQADGGQGVGVRWGAAIQHDTASRALQGKVKAADPVSTVLPEGKGDHLFDILWENTMVNSRIKDTPNLPIVSKMLLL